MVLQARLELAIPKASDFKSDVYTNSTIGVYSLLCIQVISRRTRTLHALKYGIFHLDSTSEPPFVRRCVSTIFTTEIIVLFYYFKILMSSMFYNFNTRHLINSFLTDGTRLSVQRFSFTSIPQYNHSIRF